VYLFLDLRLMQLLAISGSLRAASVNTALLRGLCDAALPPVSVKLWPGLAEIPPFSPDREGALTPPAVLDFAARVAAADGLVISCPEYVHALPGAFKNALDWLVSRPELIGKPIALMHASSRGDDVLADLRRVLATVSDRFSEEIFLRLPVSNLTPAAIATYCRTPETSALLSAFVDSFRAYIMRETEKAQSRSEERE